MTWTQLHDACQHQDGAIVQRLSWTNSGDAAELDDHQATPLHVLCLSPPVDLKALKALLEASPHTATDQDIHGDTPLHVACRSGSVDKHSVKMLLDAAPTSVSMANHEGLMPLHLACRHAPSNEEVIGLLIDVYPYALRHRIKMGNLTSKRQNSLLETKKPTDHPFIDPATSGRMRAGSFEERFRDADIQVRDGAYPIHIAVGAGAPRYIVEMLIKAADDMVMRTNKFGETPLMIALRRRVPDEELVHVLVAACTDAVRLRDKKGNLPIHAAATCGASVHTIKDLLRQWPETIHETNGEGLTALELAVQSSTCSEEVLRLLAITDHSA